MAKNMTGVEIRPTAAGRKAIEEGRYADAAALPSRMKQYRVSRRVEGRRVQTRFCATAAEAEEQFDELLAKVSRGTKVDAKTARINVEQYAERWLKRREALVAGGALAQDTLDNNRTQLRAYVIPALGYRPLSALEGDEILAWRNGLKARDGKPLAESSRIKATAALSTMLSDAVDDGVLDRSPMRKRSGRAAVPRAREQVAENLYVEPRQLLRLSQAIDQEYELMILVSGLCGLRIGECIALKGASVTDAGDLLVAQSADKSGVLKATKTYEGRTVRMPSTLAPRVKALAHKRKANERLFQTARGGSISRTNFRTRTFANARDAAATAVSTLQGALGGTDMRPGYFCDRTLERVQVALWGAEEVGAKEWRALGVEGPVARTTLAPGDRDFSIDFTFHDLRHTAASLAIASGANIKAVQQMLGHRTASVTLDTYAGLFESDRVSTAEGVGKLFEASLTPGGQASEEGSPPGGQEEGVLIDA